MNGPVQRSRIARPLIRTAASASRPHAITNNTRGPISNNGPRIDASAAALGIIPPSPTSCSPSFPGVASARDRRRWPSLGQVSRKQVWRKRASAYRDHPGEYGEWRAHTKISRPHHTPQPARLLIFNFNAGQGRASSTPPAAPRCARLRHATYSRAEPRYPQSKANARGSIAPNIPGPSLAALRLPHPGPARLHASGVEPARGPAFPLLISNRADANKGVRP